MHSHVLSLLLSRTHSRTRSRALSPSPYIFLSLPHSLSQSLAVSSFTRSLSSPLPALALALSHALTRLSHSPAIFPTLSHSLFHSLARLSFTRSPSIFSRDSYSQSLAHAWIGRCMTCFGEKDFNTYAHNIYIRKHIFTLFTRAYFSLPLLPSPSRSLTHSLTHSLSMVTRDSCSHSFAHVFSTYVQKCSEILYISISTLHVRIPCSGMGWLRLVGSFKM